MIRILNMPQPKMYEELSIIMYQLYEVLQEESRDGKTFDLNPIFLMHIEAAFKLTRSFKKK